MAKVSKVIQCPHCKDIAGDLAALCGTCQGIRYVRISIPTTDEILEFIKTNKPRGGGLLI